MILNYMDKNSNILYYNKMLKIDKYLNYYFNENNSRQQMSFNKNRKKIKDIKNIIVNMKKNYCSENAIFRKKSNKNEKKEKISPKNNLFKNYYTSKGSYWKKEENNNNVFEKLLIDKSQNNICEKKLYEKKKIIYKSPSGPISNKNEKTSSTIQPSYNDNKSTKKIIKNEYTNKEKINLKESDIINSLSRKMSSENRIIPLNEKKLQILNKELKKIIFALIKK